MPSLVVTQRALSGPTATPFLHLTGHSCTYLWCNIMVMQCWLSHSALIVPLSYLCKQKLRRSPATASKSSAISQPSFSILHCSHWHRGELGLSHTPELQPRRAQFSSLWPEWTWEGMNTQAAQCTPAPKRCRPCWEEHSFPNTSLHLWAPLLSRSPWLPQSSCSPGLMEHRCTLKGVSVNQNPHLWNASQEEPSPHHHVSQST